MNLEPPVDWLLSVSVDLHLPGEWEPRLERVPSLRARAHVADGVEYLRGVDPWLLEPELVAGEGQHLEVLAGEVLLHQRVQRVVLRGEASERGHVHDQEHLCA